MSTRSETNDQRIYDRCIIRVGQLEAENAKLRETLKVLMMGTNAELCSDRDEADCRMCSMHHGEDGCTVVDAMKLLGIDMYGMPLGVGVDE